MADQGGPSWHHDCGHDCREGRGCDRPEHYLGCDCLMMRADIGLQRMGLGEAQAAYAHERDRARLRSTVRLRYQEPPRARVASQTDAELLRLKAVRDELADPAGQGVRSRWMGPREVVRVYRDERERAARRPTFVLLRQERHWTEAETQTKGEQIRLRAVRDELRARRVRLPARGYGHA